TQYVYFLRFPYIQYLQDMFLRVVRIAHILFRYCLNLLVYNAHDESVLYQTSFPLGNIQNSADGLNLNRYIRPYGTQRLSSNLYLWLSLTFLKTRFARVQKQI